MDSWQAGPSFIAFGQKSCVSWFCHLQYFKWRLYLGPRF